MQTIKKYFNRLAVFGAGLFAAASVQAAAISFSTNAANVTGVVLATNANQIFQVLLANTSTSAVGVTIFDSPWPSNYFIIPSYTNSYITNITYAYLYTNTVLGGPSTVTNFNGYVGTQAATITTNTYYNVMQTVFVTNNPITNNYPVVLSVVIPASQTYTWTPAVNAYNFQGLLITNGTPTNGAGTMTATLNVVPFK